LRRFTCSECASIPSGALHHAYNFRRLRLEIRHGESGRRIAPRCHAEERGTAFRGALLGGKVNVDQPSPIPRTEGTLLVPVHGPFDIMPLPDCAVFASQLISSTAQLEAWSTRGQRIMGPVQVVTITQADGVRRVRCKAFWQNWD
jgi:hypothetical protein